jgi:hypothetical protein
MKQPKKIGLGETRKCWECDRKLIFSDFLSVNRDEDPKELERIWQDCRVQLHCCRCFEIEENREKIDLLNEKGLYNPEKRLALLNILNLLLENQVLNKSFVETIKEQDLRAIYETFKDLNINFGDLLGYIDNISRDFENNAIEIYFEDNYPGVDFIKIFEKKSDLEYYLIEASLFGKIVVNGITSIRDWSLHFDIDLLRETLEDKLILEYKDGKIFDIPIEEINKRIKENPFKLIKNIQKRKGINYINDILYPILDYEEQREIVAENLHEWGYKINQLPNNYYYAIDDITKKE